MTKRVIHVTEAEAASDFASLLARVRAGAEIVFESGSSPIAIVQTCPTRATQDLRVHRVAAGRFDRND